MDMDRLPNLVLIIIALAMGLFLTIKPDKAAWFGAPTKKSILVSRIIGTLRVS